MALGFSFIEKQNIERKSKKFHNLFFNMALFSFIALIFFTTILFPLANTLNNNSTSLDALLRDFALETIVENRSHHNTGVLYKATSPRNLSGVEISILKIRSRELWNKGANFGHVEIPPRTISRPHVKRLALVYQDLGNWSNYYYNIRGYNLIAPVIGFKAFDASDPSSGTIASVALSTTADPISIRFPGLRSRSDDTKCVTFFGDGTSLVADMAGPGLCRSREGGHFSIVKAVVSEQRVWHWWLRGFVIGCSVLVLLGFVSSVLMRLLRTKKIQIMERQAGEDLVLSSRWIGQSKMPTADGTRTLPSLENGCFT